MFSFVDECFDGLVEVGVESKYGVNDTVERMPGAMTRVRAVVGVFGPYDGLLGIGAGIAAVVGVSWGARTSTQAVSRASIP